MKVNKLIVSALTILSVSTMGLATVASNADTALAKTKAAKIVKTTTYKAKQKVHITKGSLYTTAKLTKVSHKAKNYRHTTFYRIKKAKVVKSNKKKAVYNYVKSTNGKTKGWIWHGYVKTGKAPKAKTSEAVTSSAKSSSSSSVSSSNKISTSKLKSMKKIMKNSSNPAVINNWLLKPGKKGSGALTDSKGYLKVAKGTQKYMLDDSEYVGTLSNGHRVLGQTVHQKYAFEVMPGIHSNSETFSNSSNHWKLYFVSGNGKNDKKILAEPHIGFKYVSDLDESLKPALGSIPLNIKSSSNSILYNWKTKTVLVNKVAAESGLWG
ncbi:hypothetical protein [Levilactobacillus yonginensis]|uniref:hypothetical protein n=1 Tax=Levilactobacillus yonginensis TaxID=1054041 RepID=UPI00345D9674